MPEEIPLSQVDFSQLSSSPAPAEIPLDQVDVSKLSAFAPGEIPLNQVDPTKLKGEAEFLGGETRKDLVLAAAGEYRQGKVTRPELKKYADAYSQPERLGSVLDKGLNKKPEEAIAPVQTGVPAIDFLGRAAQAITPDSLTRMGQFMAGSTFELLNEASKALLQYNAMTAQVIDEPTSRQAASNIPAAIKLNALEGADMVRTFTQRLANKMIYGFGRGDAREWKLERGADGKLVRVPRTQDTEKRAVLEQQFWDDLDIQLAKEGVREGADLDTEALKAIPLPEPEVVQSISSSPLVDPTMALPMGEAVKAGQVVDLAARALRSSQPTLFGKVSKAAGRQIAKPFELSVSAVENAGKILDNNPLMRGLLVAGGVDAVGGSKEADLVAFALGAKAKTGLSKQLSGSLQRTADRLSGRIPPGPVGSFVSRVGSVLGKEFKPIVAGQLSNLPFALGAGSEEEFSNMVQAGILAHAAVRSGTALVGGGLNTAKNLWTANRSLPAERMPYSAHGDEIFDLGTQKLSTELDNGDHNFVESVRKAMRKLSGGSGELYVLNEADFGAGLTRLANEGGWTAPSMEGGPGTPLTPDQVAQASKQAGVTLQKLDPQTGKARTIALAQVKPGMPGLAVGHEAMHVLDLTSSPEERRLMREETRRYFSDDQIYKYFIRYRDLVDPERTNREADPKSFEEMRPADVSATVSEILAEHGNAVLNSLPIAQLVPEGSTPKAHRDYSRLVYGYLDRLLERIGAKQPQLVDGSSVVRTGTGMELSSRLGKTIENVLQAKALDQKVLPGLADSVTVPEKQPISGAAPTGETAGPLQNVRPVEQKPIPAVKKGDPVGDIKDQNGMLVGEDAVISKVLPDERVEVSFVNPDTGIRQVGEIAVADLPVSTVRPTETTVSKGPTSPVTSETPAGAGPAIGERTQRPLTASDIVAPKAVENVVRPQAETRPANIRATEAQQNQFGEASPEVVQKNTSDLEARFQKPRNEQTPVEIEYRGAETDIWSPDQQVREEQRLARDAAEVAAQREGRPNPLSRVFSKITVPLRWGKGKSTFWGWSLDKVASNLEFLRGWLELNPAAKVAVDSAYLSGPEIAADLNKYLENISNGYQGTGKPVVLPADAKPGTVTPQNPNFVPHQIPYAKAQVLNLLQGLEQPFSATPGNEFARRMAEMNGIVPVKVQAREGVATDQNPLRARLRNEFGFNDRILNGAIEQIRTNRVVSEIRPRTDLNFRGGDTAAVQAGFMPATPVRLGKEKVSNTGLPLGREVLKGSKVLGHVQETVNEGFQANTLAGETVGTAPTAREAAKLLENAKATPKAAPVPVQATSVGVKLSPTAWILPDGTHAGQTPGQNVNFQNVGDFHSEWLRQNGAKWGLTTGNRPEALNKGLVRTRLDGRTGRMGIEANGRFLKGRVLDKLVDVVEDNLNRIGYLDINVFNDKGGVVRTESIPVFRMEPFEASQAVLDALKGRKTGDMAYMPATPGFYSGLEETLSKIPAKSTRQQVEAALRGGVKERGQLVARPVKAEEMRDVRDSAGTSFEQFLKDNPAATREEMLDFVSENRVQTKEDVLPDIATLPEGVVLHKQKDGTFTATDRGEEMDGFWESKEDAVRALGGTDKSPKFAQYVLPGGENYAETILTLPEPENKLPGGLKVRQVEYDGKLIDKVGVYRGDILIWNGDRISEHGGDLAAAIDSTTQKYVRNPDNKERKVGYKSSHFPDVPNYLAHARHNERTTPAGEKVFFVEELQSDLHQKGRKEGYRTPLTEAETAEVVRLTMERQLLWDRYASQNAASQAVAARKKMTPAERETELQLSTRIAELDAKKNISALDAPFKKSWHELAFKRMLRKAAEANADFIAWTTGEQQAERYDLSKSVDKVVVGPSTEDGLYEVKAYKDGNRVINQDLIPENELSDYVGKDLAQKAVADGAKEKDQAYSGLDLKVGGEGMKGFYDEMLPRFADKYLKRFGVRTEPVSLGSAPGEKFFSVLPNGQRIPHRTQRAADAYSEQYDGKTLSAEEAAVQVHGVRLTPELKAEVFDKGQPMYMPAQPEQRKFQAAVWVDGKVYPGKLHYGALLNAADEGAFKSRGIQDASQLEDKMLGKFFSFASIGALDGFVDDKGNFLTREDTARAIGKEHLTAPDSMDIPPSMRFMPERLVPATPEDFSSKNIKDLLQKDDWAILTAHNKNAQKQSPAENAAQNAELVAELQEMGVPFKPTVGKYGNVEDSFYVTNLPTAEVQRLIAKYGQESAAVNRGLLYQDGSVQPAKGITVHETKPDDFYTTLPDGGYFTTDVDFDAPRIPAETAKLAKEEGIVRDPRQTPAYKEIVRGLSKEEKAGIRKDTAQSIVEHFSTLPGDKDMEFAARMGMAKRGWYKRAAVDLRKIFAEDTEKFVSLLAATSPRQPVEKNLTMALTIWRDWVKAGRPSDVATLRDLVTATAGLPSRIPNVLRALAGQDLVEIPLSSSKKLDEKTELSGYKVESFRRNLLGDLFASTNDSWMAQFAGIDQKVFGTKAGYLAFTAKVRRVAKKLGIEPAEVQETVWSFFKTLVESTKVDLPAREALLAITEQQILNTPEFHDEILNNPEVRSLLGELGFDDARLATLGDTEFAGRRALAGNRSLADEIVRGDPGKGSSRVLARLAARAQRIKDAETKALAEARANVVPEAPGEEPF